MDGILRATERKPPITGTVSQVLEDRVVVRLDNTNCVHLAKKDQELRALYSCLKPDAVVVVECIGMRDKITYGRLLG